MARSGRDHQEPPPKDWRTARRDASIIRIRTIRQPALLQSQNRCCLRLPSFELSRHGGDRKARREPLSPLPAITEILCPPPALDRTGASATPIPRVSVDGHLW